MGRSRRAIALSEPAAARLSAYDWPGNVRELENCMERAVARARGDEITVDDLPERIRQFRAAVWAPLTGDAVETDVTSLFDAEREHVLRAIQQFGGNKTRAAEILGIDRRTLYRRLIRYEAER